MNRARNILFDVAPHGSKVPGAPDPSPSAPLASWYTPAFSDGLGDRLLMSDNTSHAPLELLRFHRQFGDRPPFERLLRRRVEEFGSFSHPSVATVRGVDWLGPGEGLALISTHTPGRRLSEVLHDAKGAALAMELVRQLAPALAALHQHGEGLAHGVLTADRIVVTPEGRLVMVEHVLASALESLRLPASGLQSQLGIAVLGDDVSLDPRNDVIQLGLMALSLLLGRRLKPTDYPERSRLLLAESAWDHRGASTSTRLCAWIERALQMSESSFESGAEALAALGDLPAPARTIDPAPAPTVELPRMLYAVQPRPVALVEPLETPTLALETPLETPAPAQQDTPRKFRLIASATTMTGRLRSQVTPWRVAAAGFAALALAEAVYIAALLSGAPVPGSGIAQPGAGGATNATAGLASIGGLPAKIDGSSPTGASTATPSPATPAGTPVGTPVATPAVGASAELGRLDVTSDPPGALVTVDNTMRGLTPLQLPIGVGAHNVSVSDGVTTTRRTVNVVAGATATVMAAFTPPAAAAGWVSFTSPIELQVSEGGTLIGNTGVARLMLPAGRHDLDVGSEALGFTAKVPVDVQAGRLVTATVTVPMGSISINAVPWANVSIDGRAIGTTPVANMEVPLGVHEVVWRHPQYGERRQTITVTARQPVRLIFDLTKQ